MSPWILLLAAVALAGGLLVLHGAGRTKCDSEQMLDEYRRLLEEARRARAKAAAQAENASKTKKT